MSESLPLEYCLCFVFCGALLPDIPRPGFPPLRALTPRRLSQSHVAPLPPYGPPRSCRGDPRSGEHGEQPHGPNLTSPPHLLSDAQILPLLFSHSARRVPRTGPAH